MTSDCPVPNLFPGAEGVAIAIFQISVFAMFLMLFRYISGRRGGRRSYLSNVDNLYMFDALPICFGASSHPIWEPPGHPRNLPDTSGTSTWGTLRALWVSFSQRFVLLAACWMRQRPLAAETRPSGSILGPLWLAKR